MRTIILGCGYVGSALGAELVRHGHEVIGVTRSTGSEQAIIALGIQPRVADCSTSDGARMACEGGADMVVFSVSSRGGDYRRTYVEGMRQVLSALESQPPRYFFFTGSTAVYAQTDGGWVAEDAPAEPPHENGKRLLETENLLRAAAARRFTARVLRLSGVYGPGRHAVLDKLRGGAETLPGDGNRWINQIHRDDAVQAILFLMRSGNEDRAFRIFNVTDDAPVLQRDYVAWLCRHLGRPPPRFQPDAPLGRGGREGTAANRRISNHRLRAQGWAPRHPSYREGLPPLPAAPFGNGRAVPI
ncbi:MAG: SDR family oxidoreductase [Verrucomicrobia bacterium]|nr:SDR family oxidoreductase [Verrucomicrobiota bacterium]